MTTMNRKGINPSIWGPGGWHILHRLSFCIKNLDDINVIFGTLKVILPCGTCRQNIENHLNILIIPKNINDIPEWVYKLHNRVNDKTEISFNDVKLLYKNKKISEKIEWKFIKSVIKTHKGFYKESPEFIQNLNTFFDIYVKYTDNIRETPDTTSKNSLNQWVQKYSNK